MKFAIRADASLQIGSGHIMRCLTLADLLQKQGHDITFICREHDGHLADFIQQKGFAVHLLVKSENLDFSKNYAHSDWLGKSENNDFTECQPILTALQPDWLIIDHYAIGKNWERQVKQLLPNVKILVIDDLADREHDSDILLDQTFGRKIEDYQTLVPKKCRLLLGTRYALLREEFGEWREKSLNRRKNLTEAKTILVNLGGVDKDNVTLKILQNLQFFCQNFAEKFNVAFQVTAVMGKTAPHINSVQNFAKTANFPYEVLVGVSNMAELMANSDIAIGAGGSTTWERCCLGVPTLLVVLADNQRHLAEVLDDKQAVIGLDNLANFDKEFTLKFENLLKNIKVLSRKSSQIVDAQGAKRVANYLEFAQKLQNCNVRQVTQADTQLVWQWRNHADVRQWMFGQDEIVLADHEKWFDKQLKNPNVYLLIFMQNNEPMGFVNFTQITLDKYQTLNSPKPKQNKPNEKTASWGFYLSPNSPKGQGLGFALSVMAISHIFNTTDIGKITAQVLEYNSASLALHKKLGFSEKGVLKQHFGVDDRVFDVVEFELLKEDFSF